MGPDSQPGELESSQSLVLTVCFSVLWGSPEQHMSWLNSLHTLTLHPLQNCASGEISPGTCSTKKTYSHTPENGG